MNLPENLTASDVIQQWEKFQMKTIESKQNVRALVNRWSGDRVKAFAAAQRPELIGLIENSHIQIDSEHQSVVITPRDQMTDHLLSSLKRFIRVPDSIRSYSVRVQPRRTAIS